MKDAPIHRGIDSDYKAMAVTYLRGDCDPLTYAQRFAALYPAGVTIIIPSNNERCHQIADVVLSKSKDVVIQEGVVWKLTTEEVDDIVLDKKSYFRKVYQSNFNESYYQLCDYFDEMDEKLHGTFSHQFIKDKDMKTAVLNTLKVTTDKYAKFSRIFNERDILIIDDPVSQEQSSKDACQIIKESYAPKSITVLTL